MKAEAPIIAIVAGEASGDLLGADLIRGLRNYFPDAIYEGIGGPKMQAEGFNSLHEMERLSVMGFVEPLKRLPELLGIRKEVIRRYTQLQPVVFIGIDSPDFNSHIERSLHSVGIKTVHYVSPSVWAWRQGRIKGIKKTVDLMLTLLPFEAEFYRKHSVPVRFVGHPLAGQIPMKPDAIKAKELLGLKLTKPVLCLMPGSRGGEVELMADLFLEVGKQVSSLFEDLQLVIPAANEARYRQLQTILSDRDQSNVKLLLQQSHLAMEASDAILLASGTTALEAMLFKKPMVVSYRLSRLTHALVRRFIKTPFVSIPNLLADEMLVPELIQDNASVTNLTHAVASALSQDKKDLLVEHFEGLHEVLALESGHIASKAIAELVG